jgi:SAM-dependent methyltransferase
MDPEIIGTAPNDIAFEQAWQRWWDSAAGQELLAWEQRCADAWLSDVFGFYALQLGRVSLDALRSNRMPFQWLASGHLAGGETNPKGHTPHLFSDPRALPFAEQSLDLLVLAHALDGLDQPLAALREAHRVLVPEGRLLVLGLNPWSVWGLRQRRARLLEALGGRKRAQVALMPSASVPSLRNWLQVLGFADIMGLSSAAGTLPQEEAWPMTGLRSWTQWGSAYAIGATKRVGATKPLYALRRSSPQVAKSPVPVVSQNPHV